MSVSDKEHIRQLYFVIAMFIGAILLAYNSTDTDKEEELSAHIKCLEDNNIVIDKEAYQKWEDEVEEWFENDVGKKEMPVNEEVARVMKASLETCGHLI